MNKQRAEVGVVGTDGSTHVFRLGSGAICQIEETLNIDVMEIFELIQKGKVRLSVVREFVKASSVNNPDMTNEQANDVIDDCGVMPLLSAITDSILLTFNIKTKEGEKANPPKPARAKKAAGSGSLSGPRKLAS